MHVNIYQHYNLFAHVVFYSIHWKVPKRDQVRIQIVKPKINFLEAYFEKIGLDFFDDFSLLFFITEVREIVAAILLHIISYTEMQYRHFYDLMHIIIKKLFGKVWQILTHSWRLVMILNPRGRKIVLLLEATLFQNHWLDPSWSDKGKL